MFLVDFAKTDHNYHTVDHPLYPDLYPPITLKGGMKYGELVSPEI
jgi:hypothetical protein